MKEPSIRKFSTLDGWSQTRSINSLTEVDEGFAPVRPLTLFSQVCTRGSLLGSA